MKLSLCTSERMSLNSIKCLCVKYSFLNNLKKRFLQFDILEAFSIFDPADGEDDIAQEKLSVLRSIQYGN